MNTKEKEFKYQEKTYKVVMPSTRVREESEEIELKAFAEGMRQGLLCQDEVEKLLRKRGIWSDKDQKELDDVRSEIANLIAQLRRETGKKKSQKIYQRIKHRRQKEQDLFSKYDKYFSMTCDSRAQNQRLMYLVYSCVLDKDGNKVWDTFDDFKGEDNTEFLAEAVNQAMSFFLNLDIDLSTYPEDRVLEEKNKSDKTNKEKSQKKSASSS